MKNCTRKRIPLSKQRTPQRTAGKKTVKFLKMICWILVPMIIAALIVLDALGIYIFSTERLLVLGVGLLIILLPFFSEISWKNLTVKRDTSGE